MAYLSKNIFNVVRLLLSIHFLIALLYLVFVHSVKLDGSILEFLNKDSIRVYYLLFILIFLFDIYLFVKKLGIINKKINLYKVSMFLLPALLISFIVYCLHSFGYGVPIWGDELYQYVMSLGSPIDAAGEQHQMPLSYLQSFTSYNLLGYSRLSIRFFTYLCFSLFLVLIYFYVYKKTNGSFWFSLLAVLLCLGSERLQYHSIDARPQALGLVYLFLFLDNLEEFLKVKKVNLQNAFSLMIVVVIFLTSIGFQPLFLVFSLVVFVPLGFSVKGGGVRYAKLITVLVISFLIFLPLQIYTKNTSPSRFSDIGLVDRIVKNFIEFNSPDFNSLYLVNTNWLNFCLQILFVLAFVIIFTFKNKKKYNNELRGFAYFLVSFVFVCFLEFNFYKNNIEWHFKYRYLSLNLPLFYISLVLFFYYIKNKIGVIEYYFKPLYYLFVMFFIFQINISDYNRIIDKLDWYTYDSYNIFEGIKENIEPNSIVFCLSEKWNYEFGHCSGLIMANDLIGMENIKSEGVVKNYQLYPRFSGGAIGAYNRIQGTQAAFVIKASREKLNVIKEIIGVGHKVISGEKHIIVIIQGSSDQISKEVRRASLNLDKYFKENNLKYYKGYKGFEKLISRLKESDLAVK